MPSQVDLSPVSVSTEKKQLRLPRILCLHGGGTNARIFTAQCRALRRHVSDSYRLVFADAPFVSTPGPDVTSVYGQWGPFRSWVPVPSGVTIGEWAAASANLRVDVDVEAIDECITAAMERDDAAGATGDWIGLLGFSQGARVAASLLYREQRLAAGRSRRRGGVTTKKNTGYRFAILFAGRGPLLDLDFGFDSLSASRSAAVSAHASASESDDEGGDLLLQIPTLHIHGLRDPGLEMHRDLVRYCQRSSVRVVEWDGGHRMPITTKDVGKVVAEIRHLAISHKYESLR